MATDETTSQRPYLLRAMYEWMTDSGLTPHIVVDASVAGLSVPTEHVSDGKIVLNISFSATKSLSMGNDILSFEARFNGVPHGIRVPVPGVLGIYARETGQGMVFPQETNEPPPDGTDPGPTRSERPALKVVK